MSENVTIDESFVKLDSTAGLESTVRTAWRVVRSLKWLCRLLPVTLLVILGASAAPSVFRWYAGELGANPTRGAFVLVAIALAGTALRILAWALFEVVGMWDAQKIHAQMAEGLARTRITYFDENPSGRIVNRLGRDFEELRETAVIFIGDTLNAFIEIVSIAVIAAIANPWAALAILPLLLAFSFVQARRARALGHARALASVATGKVLDRQSDLIYGRETYLLYGHIGELRRRLGVALRDYAQAGALTARIETRSSLAIGICTEVFSLGVLLMLSAGLARGRVDAVFAAVLLSALFGMTASMGWLDFATSQLSRALGNCRRVFQIVDLPAEETEERAREADAPAHPRMASPRIASLAAASPAPVNAGPPAIEFRDFTMSYRPGLPEILRDIRLIVARGERIALIGRTGSGKSSLIQSLLRMVYVRSGDVLINGLSVYNDPARRTREQFAIVPQAPYLFAGTLAANLDRRDERDPAGQAAMREALRTVGLARSPDFIIEEGGKNLSFGERQQVSLARALLSDRPILLMDEPTSGLDPETDARLSRVIATGLAGRTLITIAHRRESLYLYDRIIEIADGRVARSGPPESILAT